MEKDQFKNRRFLTFTGMRSFAMGHVVFKLKMIDAREFT